MWSEVLPSGKVRFAERYMHPLTGAKMKVSITLAKDNAQTRKQAQKALQEKIDAKLKEYKAVTKKSEITLEELVTAYREDQKTSVQASTYTRNRFAMDALLRILGKDTIVERITAGYVREQLLKTGDSNGTMNERITRFKALMRWGYVNDYVADVQFLDKILKFPDKEKKEKLADKFLESAELTTLLKNMDVDKWRMLTALTALSGMRIGEAIALHSSDIDFQNKTIQVTKTYDRLNNIVTSPKTAASIRDIYMQPELERLCRQIKAYTLRQKLLYGFETELFMCDDAGKHLNYYSYNKYLSEKTLKLFSKKVTTHFMRHTHVALMAENGVSLDAISRRLGHENSKITKDIYFHVTKKMKEQDNAQFQKVNIL